MHGKGGEREREREREREGGVEKEGARTKMDLTYEPHE